MSQEALAKALGYEGKSAISKVENGKRDISHSMIIRYAEALGVSPAFLLYGEEANQETIVDFQVAGKVAAGYGKQAYEDYGEEFFSVPEEVLRGYSKEDFIHLVVEGDSMDPLYKDGDRLLILRTPQCENGSVAVVQYGEDVNGTLKQVYFEGSAVRLKPINPKYKEIFIKGSDLDYFKIIGIPKFLARTM